MAEGVLVLDVGGSSLKSAVLDESCSPLVGSLSQHPFEPMAKLEDILGVFRAAIADGLKTAQAQGLYLHTLGAAFPGPFDFDRGLSLMSHKLSPLRGLPLGPLLSEYAGGLAVRFLHDSTAYMLGEAYSGAAAGAQAPACLMLGTGLGFAYMQSSRVCLGSDQRPHILLWSMPFLEGIAEDYVSTRAIRKRYTALRGLSESPDVRDIAALARAGDQSAREVFSTTGTLLAQMLKPLLSKLGCDRLVLGGQIARSAELFIQSLQAGLNSLVLPARFLDDAPLRGTARYCLLPQEETIIVMDRQTH